MKILLWNVNGYRSILGKGLGNILKKERPDVVCLQETKAHPDQLDENHFPLEGYDGQFSSARKKGYSGTATFCQKKLKAETRAVGIGKKAYDSEGRFVVTEVGGLLIYNVYFPSGTSGEERQNFKYKFLDDFLAHLKSLSAKDLSRTIIAGDFNICHKPIDIHHPDKAAKLGLTGFLPEERAWMDRFADFGFVDSFRRMHPGEKDAYTWWSFRANSRAKNLGWRIDYIFVHKNLQSKIRKASILKDVKGSDHCPITLELALGRAPRLKSANRS